ncbi:MAG: 50S ribosomal protein L29 [candidate division WS6 bacterium GW2011_GWF2_39_15]|uniref:Large ribosomal subunit protein uL29 n=1 Tax=candidate division WS6 bacterium GW2011_GWF2_39_15 TaxID=1619100 RepID=A0A0G0MNM4_9BACT|nr:MAG: 50S ribosomal protein L29 [candidate division WS6 bacterium GW2011_GWF2_39_15]
MKADEIRKMSVEDIKKEITSAYMELKNVTDNIRVGKEKNVRKSLNIKRNIARMLTVLKQKQNS